MTPEEEAAWQAHMELAIRDYMLEKDKQQAEQHAADRANLLILRSFGETDKD